MAQISKWLNACTGFHKGCGTLGRSYLPTRVLEITGPRQVRLYIPEENEIAPYVCLSHCWGTKACTRTTTSTFDRHRQAIPWDDLQKTFQDAVSVTYRLGIRYLWIDSLCIIQDDIHDWRHEGSLMANIYAHCYFTIAASRSSDSYQGCFIHEDYTLNVREELKHIDDVYDDPDFPLLRRAWVFQERNLSPRTVHFGPNELLWECMAKVECECLELYFSPDDRISTESSHILTPSRQWYNIVTEYSAKALTFEKDILPALQGVARVMQSKRRCQYYAGLWQDTLLLDLLWMISATCFRRGATLDPKDNDLEEPQTWHAPSWSWASVVGKVEWNSDSFTPKENNMKGSHISVRRPLAQTLLENSVAPS
ncbi:HET-domain-containing protein [Amniculicola lignicola CBS 123094]|uniref:HET-domain-containing protein n=1 Tax=Amniculicola lignicola CBS 123094 TaxID=1392246 RepID=A0A6A5VV70_9PLEO|nr:HET-domain-containing protein [Amniculicola lignicola CBS 123094]